jgi:hypothetical protein
MINKDDYINMPVQTEELSQYGGLSQYTIMDMETGELTSSMEKPLQYASKDLGDALANMEARNPSRSRAEKLDRFGRKWVQQDTCKVTNQPIYGPEISDEQAWANLYASIDLTRLPRDYESLLTTAIAAA